VFDFDEFAEVWNSSNNVSEVARRLKIPYQTAHSRACLLKQNYGYRLKKFRNIKDLYGDWFFG